jgi:hypothetical protein
MTRLKVAVSTVGRLGRGRRWVGFWVEGKDRSHLWHIGVSLGSVRRLTEPNWSESSLKRSGRKLVKIWRGQARFGRK